MRVLTVAVAALLVAGCGAVETTRTARDDLFVLTTTVPRLTYRANDEIDVQARLTYVGSEPEVTVLGPDYGLVTIWFKQLDGPLHMAPLSILMCSRQFITLKRGVAVAFPPAKPGAAYDPNAPTASFYRSWNADPKLHLPVGRWQIQSRLSTCGGTGPGGNDHVLTTPPLIVSVVP